MGTSSAVSIDNGFDGHVHTYLCGHATGTMEEYVLAALSKGLHTICFLEHLEADIKDVEKSWLTESEFQLYFEQGLRLKEKYGDSIKILLGVEAGFNPDAQELFLKNLELFPWDRVGLSNHFVRVDDQYLNVLSRKKQYLNKLAEHGSGKVALKYYASILEALSIMKKCDVVCHLDAVMRHHAGIRLTEKHLQLIDTILDIMSSKNITLELNTSGFSLKGRPYPSKDLITAAVKKGVRLQAGSDAHAPNQVGRHFSRLQQYLDEEIHI